MVSRLGLVRIRDRVSSRGFGGRVRPQYWDSVYVAGILVGREQVYLARRQVYLA
jgi:hypothetical protein